MRPFWSRVLSPLGRFCVTPWVAFWAVPVSLLLPPWVAFWGQPWPLFLREAARLGPGCLHAKPPTEPSTFEHTSQPLVPCCLVALPWVVLQNFLVWTRKGAIKGGLHTTNKPKQCSDCTLPPKNGTSGVLVLGSCFRTLLAEFSKVDLQASKIIIQSCNRMWDGDG